MRIYTHRILISAPLQRVADFHADSRALQRLTPPPVFVQMHFVEPVAENSKAEFTLWIGPLPVRWLAVHSNVHTQHGFTDTQLRGPFKHWVHQHSFRAVDEKTTEILDEIRAEPGDHPLWGLVSRFMWLNLPLMFAYRGWVMRRLIQ
ncbi:MAG: hypothetical protein JXB15_17050 [Anaerolineales bacterium]|nr:hypothetical protein [Anaerolineales bacterium]